MSTLSEELKLAISRIEACWETVAAATISETIAEHPDEDFYAAGFWLFALDGATISAPALAINSEAGVSEADSFGEDNRWNPADWSRSVIMSADDAVTPAYIELSELLAGAEWSVYEAIDEFHKLAIAHVCRRLTTRIRNRDTPFDVVPVNSRFIVGIFDGRDSEAETDRLVRLSIDPDLIDELNIPFLR